MGKDDEARMSQGGEGRIRVRWPRGRCASEWALPRWPYGARCVGEPGHEAPCVDVNGLPAPDNTPGMATPALGSGTLLAIVSRRENGTVVIACMHSRCTVSADLNIEVYPESALARVVDHAATEHD